MTKINCVTYSQSSHKSAVSALNVSMILENNCIFTVRVPYAYVIPEGNVRSHLGSHVR